MAVRGTTNNPALKAFRAALHQHDLVWHFRDGTKKARHYKIVVPPSYADSLVESIRAQVQSELKAAGLDWTVETKVWYHSRHSDLSTVQGHKWVVTMPRAQA